MENVLFIDNISYDTDSVIKAYDSDITLKKINAQGTNDHF